MIAGGLLVGLLSFVAFWSYVAVRVRSSPLTKPPEHGVCFTIETDLTGAPGPNGIPELQETVRKRFDQFGTRIFWEPISQTRFRIHAPIVDEAAAKAAQDLAWRRGLLDCRLVHPDSETLISQGGSEKGYEILPVMTPRPKNQTAHETRLLVKVPAEGAPLIRIQQALCLKSSGGRGCDINISFTPESAEAFAKVTRENIGRRLAMVLDDVVLTAPRIQSEISGGKAVITTDLDRLGAIQTSILLGYPLPLQVKLVETKSF